MKTILWLTALTLFPIWIISFFVIAFFDKRSTDPILRRLPAKGSSVDVRISSLKELFLANFRKQLVYTCWIALGLVAACALFIFVFERLSFLTIFIVLLMFYLFVSIRGSLLGGTILLARYVSLRRQIFKEEL